MCPAGFLLHVPNPNFLFNSILFFLYGWLRLWGLRMATLAMSTMVRKSSDWRWTVLWLCCSWRILGEMICGKIFSVHFGKNVGFKGLIPVVYMRLHFIETDRSKLYTYAGFWKKVRARLTASHGQQSFGVQVAILSLESSGVYIWQSPWWCDCISSSCVEFLTYHTHWKYTHFFHPEPQVYSETWSQWGLARYVISHVSPGSWANLSWIDWRIEEFFFDSGWRDKNIADNAGSYRDVGWVDYQIINISCHGSPA